MMDQEDLWKNGGWNCGLATDCYDHLSRGDVDDTKLDTVPTEVICQKDQERHNPDCFCDDWIPRPE